MPKRMKIVVAIALAVIVGNLAWVYIEPKINLPPLPPHPDVIRAQELTPIAEGGDVDAQFQLAELYYHARGIPRDDERALSLYQTSANGGHPGGQFGLGRMYENGRGVHLDSARAAEWYRVSALLGRYADAQYALGKLYFAGRGVDQSYGIAMEWFIKAAKGGHAASQHLVGTMHRDGWGVPVDRTRAHMWFSLSAEHADQSMAVKASFDPVEALRKLEGRMTRVQLREARKMLAQHISRR